MAEVAAFAKTVLAKPGRTGWFRVVTLSDPVPLWTVEIVAAEQAK